MNHPLSWVLCQEHQLALDVVFIVLQCTKYMGMYLSLEVALLAVIIGVQYFVGKPVIPFILTYQFSNTQLHLKHS